MAIYGEMLYGEMLLSPCAGPNRRETSIHSRFQDQSTMFEIEKLSKLVKKFAVDADTYLSSTLIQPNLKPPWNIYKVGVY